MHNLVDLSGQHELLCCGALLVVGLVYLLDDIKSAEMFFLLGTAQIKDVGIRLHIMLMTVVLCLL